MGDEQASGGFYPPGTGAALDKALATPPASLSVRSPLSSPLRPGVVAEFVWLGPGDEWQTVGDVRVTPAGSLVLGSVCVTPRPGVPLSSSGVTALVLRGVRTGELLDGVQKWLSHDVDVADARRMFATPTQPDPDDVARVDAAATAERPKGGGRKGFPDDHYRRCALDALELHNSGITRGLRAALASKWNVPPETARDWLRAARKRGFLAPAQHGRTGVSPGPRLTEGKAQP